MMPFRKEQIEYTINGLNATNEPLIALDQTGYYSAGLGDNQGVYYFVSLIAKYFNLSGDAATNIFLFSLLFLATSIAICSFFLLFKNWIFRITAIIGCFLAAKIAYLCSDIYITYFFVVFALIPLFILIKNRYPQSKWIWISTLAFSGILIGYSNFIREHSGTIVFIFILLWIALDKILNKKQKALYICFLFVFTLIPYTHQKSLTMKRDLFLTQHSKTKTFLLNQNQPNPFEESIPTNTKNTNTFKAPSTPIFCKWHLFYIGLGYKKNKYGIQYSDHFGLMKARSHNPEIQYLSKKYDQILKKEYFSILKSDPWFVLHLYFRKFLSIALLIFRHVYLGILFFFFARPSWREFLPFCIAGLFGSIPGIVVIPHVKYALGALALAFSFGIYMTGLGIEKYRKASRMLAKPQNA